MHSASGIVYIKTSIHRERERKIDKESALALTLDDHVHICMCLLRTFLQCSDFEYSLMFARFFDTCIVTVEKMLHSTSFPTIIHSSK